MKEPPELYLTTLEPGHLEKGAGTMKDLAIGLAAFSVVVAVVIAIHILWVAK